MLAVYLQDSWQAEKALRAGFHPDHVHSVQHIEPEAPPVHHPWYTEWTETELDQAQLENKTKGK